MTRISSYIIDQNIVGNDKWIGSDAQNNLRTKNFTPNNLADYFNGNNVIDIGTSIRYRYQTLDVGEEREQGTISFETEIGPQVNFSDITTFLIAKNTLKGNTVTDYLDFLVDSSVMLSKSSNINTFGYYKVTSIEPWIVDPNFFVVVVEFLDGNGFIYEDLDYLVSLVDKVEGGGGNQSLNQTLVIGNATDGEDIFLSDGDSILLDNGSKLKKGTTNAGNGGNNGIALKCSLDYEFKWEAGRMYIMQQDGVGIRETRYNFNVAPTVNDDDTKGYAVDSRWVLDNGDLYICTDATTGAAVWELQTATIPSLKEVLSVEGRMPFPVTEEYFFESTNKSETIIVDTTDPLDFYLNDDIFAIGDEIEIYNKSSTNSRIGVVGIETTQIYYKDEIIDADMLNMVTLPLYSKSWLKCVAENVFELVIIEQNEPQLQDLQSVTDEGNITTNTISVQNGADSSNITSEYISANFFNTAGVGNLEFISIYYNQIVRRFWNGSAYITNIYTLPDIADNASEMLALTSDIPTLTSDLINDGENGTSPYVTADQLPSNLNLFATDASSDIPTYFKLVTSISDPDFNVTPVNIPTGTITTTGQFIAALATTANVLVGNPGIINLLTIGNVRRTSGSGTAEFYYEVYHRTSGGTETLVATSSKTPPINTNVYTEFLAAALLNNGVFLATDRIVVKYYADRIGSGSNPNYDFQFGGTSPVRTNFPVPATNIPLDATPTSGSTNGVQSGGVFDALALKADKTIQVTPVTITSGSWSLVGGLYESNYANANILSTSIVDIIPSNASVPIVLSAQLLPQTNSSAGSVKIYATNLPLSNIVVTVNIMN